jgi:hypothetical protein
MAAPPATGTNAASRSAAISAGSSLSKEGASAASAAPTAAVGSPAPGM